MNLAEELLRSAGSGVEESIGHAATPGVRWGQIVGTDPLKVRLAGDTTGDITVSLVSSDMAVRNGAKVLLARAGNLWVIITELVSPDEAGPVGLPLGMLGHWGPYQSGSYYGAWNWYNTASATSTFYHDRLQLMPIMITRSVDLEALVGGHTSTSGDLKWGLYQSDSAGWPTKILDQDTTTITGADQVYSLSASTYVSAGIYWFAANPSADINWRVINSTTYYYQNQFAYQSLEEATAAAVFSSANATATYSYYITHTYEDDLPDPFGGTPVSSATSFACGYKVA